MPGKVAKAEARRAFTDMMGKWLPVFSVRKITPYQYRFHGRVDIYPTGLKWHDITSDERGELGGVDEVTDFLLKQLAKSSPGGGGHTWMHRNGVVCGHMHPNETPHNAHTTCPACLKVMATDEWKEANPVPPPPRKPMWRVWSLKSARWVSDKVHDRPDRATQERIQLFLSVDAKLKEAAKAALYVANDMDTKALQSKQAAYDKRRGIEPRTINLAEEAATIGQ